MPIKRGPIPPAVRSLAQQMLAEGASPEEVVAMARKQGVSQVTPATVKRWIDRNPTLRENAIRRQVEAVEQLKKSLAEGDASPSARLAEAALFAGLAQPPKANSRLDLQGFILVQSSMCQELERENAVLRRRAQKLEARKDSITRRIERAQARLEHVRWRAVLLCLVHLHGPFTRLHAGAELAGDDQLSPDSTVGRQLRCSPKFGQVSKV
ncbi:MAG TPA: hypothetical protein VI455_01195 [Terriglobia bacterium]